MAPRVKIRKSQLSHFRSKARNTHLEVQAYLIGDIISPDLTVVDSINYTKLYHVQTPTRVQWTGAEYSRVKQLAESQGKRIVGDIHSHPSWDAVKSPDDHKGQIEEQLRLCGICSTSGRKTRVRFWIPESSLPVEIVYR